MTIPLEIPVFSPSSALHVQAIGAQRIELNARGSYPDGGTTPAPADLEGVNKWLMVPVRIMIRPRGKRVEDDVDFVYTEDEFATMLRDVEAFRPMLRADRGDGFVFGVLKRSSGDEGSAVGGVVVVVDVERNRRLVEAAGGLACSFHRAFDDVIRDGAAAGTIAKGVRDLAACGFGGVLTSGGPGNAAANRGALEEVVREASEVGKTAGAKGLEVIIGGGVRRENVGELVGGFKGDGSVWAHSSCLTEGEVDDEEAMGILERLAER
ncbi:CutC family protein [Colletotrichum orchidophilum]|uniref:Copper homeostasis protein cutC homolog n=1 Tax=Colletotrichum orchidophilum TaxID=1209926 RepID=A0A1G4BN07_9PEZI|nr:CutC family protein [Colletotrichum orchidophilum]OHF02852.1 CutC family protein [Colletotrichum orchidophilum]